jgi:hypothetical protein
MGLKRNTYSLLDELEGKISLRRLGVDGVIFKWNWNKLGWKAWTGLMWLGIGPNGGLL